MAGWLVLVQETECLVGLKPSTVHLKRVISLLRASHLGGEDEYDDDHDHDHEEDDLDDIMIMRTIITTILSKSSRNAMDDSPSDVPWPWMVQTDDVPELHGLLHHGRDVVTLLAVDHG